MDEKKPAPGEIVDTATLRALAHPIRWALIEALSVLGPATAAQCAAVLGESHGSCSFHLRQLARFGLVEEAPSDSKRDRPWRLVALEQRWGRSATGEESRDRAARELSRVFVERETARIQEWVRLADTVPPEWQEASTMQGMLAWLDAGELAELSAELSVVLQKHRDRIEDPARRPPGARPVRLFATAFPVFGYEDQAADDDADAGDDRTS